MHPPAPPLPMGLGGVARGCGIKYQNHQCPSPTLQYPIGRETEHLICVA